MNYNNTIERYYFMQFGLCSMNGANYEIHDNPYLRNVKWFKSTIVHNVTTFNRYIFDNIRKINKERDNETHECINDNAYSIKNAMHAYLNKHPEYLSFRDLNPKNDFTTYYLDYYMNSSDPNYKLKNDSCALHLIGTPEDIDDLLMFPDLIVIEVSDETDLFTMYYSSKSLLYAKNQIINYRLDTYYDKEPSWWSDHIIEASPIDLYDNVYSECTDFKDPGSFYNIHPFYKHMLNPDERVYKIYIKMSDDLITTAYERSNFFIDIRNSKKKMSIKNFLKYLS